MTPNSYRASTLLCLLGALALCQTRPLSGGEPPEKSPPPPRQDAYGDPLPEGAVARIGSPRLRQPDPTCAMVSSPDGKILALGKSWTGPVRLWNAATGKLIGELQASVVQPTSLAFSADGKLLASVGQQSVCVWDVAARKALVTIEYERQGPYDLTAAFSPDGKVLASAGRDNVIRLWDLAAGKMVGKLEGHEAKVFSLAFSPDGAFLVSGGLDGRDNEKKPDNTVRVWDWRKGKELHRLEGHEGWVFHVAVAADGKAIASASRDGTVRVWDPATGKETARLRGHKEDVHYVAFTPDGKALVSGAYDGTIRVWDRAKQAETCKFVATTPNTHFTTLLAPDGKVVLAGTNDGAGREWDVSTGKEVRSRPSGSTRFAVAPDGKTVTTAGATVEQWDLATGKHLRQLPATPAGTVAALSPDGRTFAVRGPDGKTSLWDVAGGKELRKLKQPFPAECLVFSPDGKMLGAMSAACEVRLYDVTTGVETLALRPDPGARGALSCRLAFSPDGSLLAAAARGRNPDDFQQPGVSTVSLWETATGKMLCRSLRPDWGVGPGEVQGLAVSPDGQLLATAGDGGVLRLWEVATGKEVTKPMRHEGQILSVTFLGSGRFIASAGSDKAVRIWDVSSGEEVRCLRGHESRVESLALGPGRKVLVSASADHTLLVWDLPALLPRDKADSAAIPARELDKFWEALGGSDAPAAERAVWALVRVPKQSVPFLKTCLAARTAPAPKELARLIEQLDDDDPKTRDKASEELARLGDSAETELRRTLKGSPSAEVKWRVEDLLRRVEEGTQSGQPLRLRRAIRILEEVGTPEARQVLTTLADEGGTSSTARAAKAALARLKGRTDVSPTP